MRVVLLFSAAEVLMVCSRSLEWFHVFSLTGHLRTE